MDHGEAMFDWDDIPPTGIVRGLRTDEKTTRPVRYDRIYEEPVKVEGEGQGAGLATHPAWDGRVPVRLPHARSALIALDDLTVSSRSALRAAKVRRRIEVTVRCSHPACCKAFRAFLTADGRVQDRMGEEIKALERFDLLFQALCGRDHREDRQGPLR